MPLNGGDSRCVKHQQRFRLKSSVELNVWPLKADDVVTGLSPSLTLYAMTSGQGWCQMTVDIRWPAGIGCGIILRSYPLPPALHEGSSGTLCTLNTRLSWRETLVISQKFYFILTFKGLVHPKIQSRLQCFKFNINTMNCCKLKCVDIWVYLNCNVT